MSDPFSLLVGSIQIAGQCAQATLALAKYIHQVATVDQRIKAFYEDLTNLRTNYEALQQCRNAPQMVSAAKAADEYTEHLWSHLATTLRDCENTLLAINHVLGKINKPPGVNAHFRQFLEKPVKQLREQLNGGELARHHDKIKMFNTSLALPMQMINITLQLSHRDLSEEHQRSLENRLVAMQKTIDLLHANIAGLNQPRSLMRSSTGGSGTLVADDDHDTAVRVRMELFAKRAKQFLSSASSIASTRSSGSTIQLDTTLPFRGTSDAGPLTQKQRARIEGWAPVIVEDPYVTPNGTEPIQTPVTEPDYLASDSDEEDFELELAQTYFEHGQSDLAKDDFAGAEENFIEALEVLQNNDFGERLAFQSADVVLLLTHCHIEQNKHDEAIKLLLPLTEEGENNEETGEGSADGARNSAPQMPRRRPDRARILAAHHSLGNVYLRKQDYVNAERHALSAFMGRRRFFGKDHEKAIESTQLVVDVYTARGENAKARAYRKNLVPNGEGSRPRRTSGNLASGSSLRPNLQNQITNGSGAPSPPLQVFSTRKTSFDPRSSDSVDATTGPSSTFGDSSTDISFPKSSIRRSMSATPRQYLKPRFDAVKSLASTSTNKACEEALHILRGYDPDSKILILRQDDIKKNIKKQGAHKGLAATGGGFAPIHFFCELKTEWVTEIELLIEDGVDLMVPRYRAGYGKQEPITPLQLAIENGHQTIATMMIDAMQASGVTASQVMTLRDRDDLSPLTAACRMSQPETVARLLEFSMFIDVAFPQNWIGNSLLHDACSRCDIEIVRLLLDLSLGGQSHGTARHDQIGFVGQRDEHGRTPLMYAVMSVNIPDQNRRNNKLKTRSQCVELLLQFLSERDADGANLRENLSIRDARSNDVLGLARIEADPTLIQLVKRFVGLSDSKGKEFAESR